MEIQKRNVTIYMRIKPVNKGWLATKAEEQKLSEAEYLDELLDALRNTDACHTERLGRSRKKARKRA